MTEKERAMSGKLYDPFRVENTWAWARQIIKEFNGSEFWKDSSAMDKLRTLFAHAGEGMMIVPPFYCDHGSKISVGRNFYANTGLIILDEAPVTIGDNVFLGPRVSIYTAGHPIDAMVRNLGLEYARPVRIGSDVWIGGGVTINPGVTIDSDVVIGSGSVVTKNIPGHVIAAGNPCRVLREITDQERKFWELQYREYLTDTAKNESLLEGASDL